MPTHFRMRLVFVIVMLTAVSALAHPASVFTPTLRRALQNIGKDGKTTLRDVALREGRLDTIEIEPMEVWAKDAKLIVFGAAGEQTLIPPPAVKYFKGRVDGEPDSAVFFSMSADGSVRGMILIGERRWNVGSGVRKGGGRERRERNGEAPVFAVEADALDELADPAADWSCEVGKINGAPHIRLPQLKATQVAKENAGNVAGATYQLRIAFETDNEFCAAFGNNNTTIGTYIGDLVGKASVVYSRDLKTTLSIGQVNYRSSGTDPWTVMPGAHPNESSTTDNAIAEFAARWHTDFPQASFPRSSAVFLSGKDFRGGFGWQGLDDFTFLCGDDFFCGADGSDCGSSVFANSYAGAYAFNGSVVSVETSVPDPTATVNGVQYGVPQTNYWMLLEFMHELGHNANGPHTQCVPLSAAEKTMYGVTRNFVDECTNFDGGSCFSGTTSGGQPCNADGTCPGGVPAEKGSIMSYCHLIIVSGFRQSRYLFGKAGETSEKMLPFFHDALELATPDPTITTQTEPVACSAGRTASVPTCSGCTYAWQITGGTISSGSTSNAITYTPTLPSVTLTATITTTRGCGITASKTVTTSCAALQPPTNVVATATSTTAVGVSWTASSGATSYNVYRSTDGLTYALAGSPTSTSFNDGSRSPNTAYLYKVRAVNGGESADSNRDLATTVIFTDDPLVAGTTPVKPAHITELRTAINAVRTLAGLGAGSYTDTNLVSGTTLIKRLHVVDLRTALDAARSNLSLSALTYGESITAGVTTIKTSHLNELRAGVQ